MNGISPNLRWLLHHLVGTRLRFGILLVCQVSGFFLTVYNRGISVRGIYELGFWGLLTPVLFLVTLRFIVVELQKATHNAAPGV